MANWHALQLRSLSPCQLKISASHPRQHLPNRKPHMDHSHIMRQFTMPSLIAVLLIAGCAGGAGDRVVVRGAGAELLKLRAGPGLGFNVILGLPDGTVLTRRDCVTEIGQRWCRVSLNAAPGTTGYVSADYLSQ